MFKKKDPVIETEDVDKSQVKDNSADDLRMKKKQKPQKTKIQLEEFQSLDEYRITLPQLQQRLEWKMNTITTETKEGADMLSKMGAGILDKLRTQKDNIKKQEDEEKAKENNLKRQMTKNEKREQERLARLEKRSKGCHKLIWGIKMFLKLKAGIMFFQYVQTPLDGDLDDDEPIDDDDEKDEAEKEEEKKACSYQKIIKNVVTAIIFLAVFFGLVKDYIDLIGKEKSQKLTYYDKTNHTYDITEIPGKMPAHHFTFLNKIEVTDRMKCKLYDNEQECLNIEQERCTLKGLTTGAYEDCMISLNTLLGMNGTQFCVDHYSNMDLWINTLSPKYVLYHQRKHSCYESSGVPKGKDFCDDMMKYNQGWSNANLFNCYRSNGVDFSQQYCEDKFNVILNPTSKTEQNLLRCFADRGIKKGKPFCDLNNKGNNQVKVQSRIDCYDSIPLITKDVCDAKQNHQAALKAMQSNGGTYDITVITSEDWDIQTTQNCYNGLGDGELNEQFCQKYHVYQKNTDRVLMTDNLYECYRLIGIPKNTDADKREKCELKFLQKMEDKYHCIRESGLIEKGDFCYLTYFWEDQYSDLYNCLTNDTHSENKYIDIDSTFCEKQYNYNLKTWKKENPAHTYIQYINQVDILHKNTDLNIQPPGKISCQAVNGSFPRTEWGLSDTTNGGRECGNIIEMKDFTDHNFTFYIPKPNNIEMSKEVKQDPVTLKECFLMEGQQSSQKATFTVSYDTVEQVHSVNVYNLQAGSKASLLTQASIYVMNSTGSDKTLCTKIEKLPPVDEILNLECEQNEEAPWLLVGDTVQIESNVPGTMTVCDFKMIANIEENDDLIQTQLDKHTECADYLHKCDTIFTSNQGPDIENYYNCRARYGRPITPQFCIDKHSSNIRPDSKFAYPLTNKYKCLMNNREIIGKVNVTEKVTGCMNLFYDYLMEECLQEYENSFDAGVIGFDTSLSVSDKNYYRSYGNNTISIADRERHLKEAEARRIAEIIASQAVQVPIVEFKEDLGLSAIRDYLCSKIDMWFYSNSYNDADINPTKIQDEIVLNMTCDIFEFYDPVLDEQQISVHFYLVEDLIFRQPLKNGSADGAFFFINRTELNEQYFQLEIQRELEFLTVRKNQMYLREQIPEEDELDVPLVKTEEEYNNFRSEVQSLKIYESQDFKIALEEHEGTILEAASQINIYDGVPDPKNPQKADLKVLEIDISSTKIVDEIIVVEPENNVRMMIELDDDQKKQEIYTTMVGFRFSFTEKQFYYKYYSVNDVIIELGGINGIVGPMLASFTQYFIILFIVDLVRKIRRKSKRDQKQFTRMTLGPRLPDYKKCIEKLLQMEPDSDAESVLSDKDKESKEIGDLVGKDLSQNQSKLDTQRDEGQGEEKEQKEGGEERKEIDEKEVNQTELPKMKKNSSKFEGEKVVLTYHKKMSKIEKRAELKDHLDMVEELMNHMEQFKEEDDEIEEEIPEEEMTEEQLEEKKRKKEEEEKQQEELRAEEEKERLEDEEARKSGKIVKKRKRKPYVKMSKLVQLEHQNDTLVLMEKIYGKFMKEFGIRTQIGEIFDDYEEVDKYLQERRQITFLKVVELFKKRLSFFGIYSLNDQIELTNQKAIYLRKQLSVVVKLLLKFQNKLISDIESERKDTVNFINTRFSMLSAQARAQDDGQEYYQKVGEDLQCKFDGDLKKIHDEVQNIKKEIQSGALQDKMSDVLTKKNHVFTGNLKNEIIYANRLIFEADIYKFIFDTHEKIEANINDGKQEVVFRDVKNILYKMREFGELNSQNVQKVMNVLPKVNAPYKESFDLLFRTIDDSYMNWGQIQENFEVLRGLQDAVWQAILDHGEVNARQRAQMEDEKNNWFEIEQLTDQVNKDLAILMKEAKISYEKIGEQSQSQQQSNEVTPSRIEFKKNKNKN